MTIKECYAAMGGDYQDVLRRFRSEALLEKLSVKFLEDTTYQTLRSALEAENAQEAFRAAHTLKGISQNLGFTQLYQASCVLTEALRGGFLPVDEKIVKEVETAFWKTTASLKKLSKRDG